MTTMCFHMSWVTWEPEVHVKQEERCAWWGDAEAVWHQVTRARVKKCKAGGRSCVYVCARLGVCGTFLDRMAIEKPSKEVTDEQDTD